MSTTPPPTPVGYAGDLSPAEAWRRVQAGEAVLVDVRTSDELFWIGRVPGAPAVEWAQGRGMTPNPNFVAELAAVVPKDTPVLFLCRSGGRSVSAAKAATAAGYRAAFNVLEGFEGVLDQNRQRGTLGGWRKAGLPWEQG
ncbi:MAG: rhodanese-like domain-containing protein [Lautropia sp.]